MNRVTNRMLFNNTLYNVHRQSSGMLNAQEQIATGKRVNRPSDDPLAIGEILTFKTRIERSDKFIQVAQKAETFLGTSDSIIAQVTQIGVRAKELALAQSQGTAQTRSITAREIEQLVDEAISIGNSKIGNEYIFGGRNTNNPAIDANGIYQGDNTELSAEIDENVTLNMSVLASEFLTTDLNPTLNSATAISSLNGGTGVTAGSFAITDRAGGTGTVNVAAGATIGNVISAINASGANVTASISSNGMGIAIVDNTAAGSVTGAMTISSTATATSLGIAGTRNVQNFIGSDLNPSATSSTLLSDLNGGLGFAPTSIGINNGPASATVTFAGASTLGDIVTAINASGTNVVSTINSSGSGLTLASATSGTVAFATDLGTGNTAEFFGIGGGRNLISTLQMLRLAMDSNDGNAIRGAIGNLTTAIDTSASVRGKIGARTNRVTNTLSTLDQSRFDNTKMLSNAQDADLEKVISDLALLEQAYQATIKTASTIIQPSLIDFLR